MSLKTSVTSCTREVLPSRALEGHKQNVSLPVLDYTMISNLNGRGIQQFSMFYNGVTCLFVF